MDAALGICVLGNKVIVTCAPNVIVFTDEDGDDKPDNRKLLFTQAGRPQDDHSTHSFVFGPDGKLYWNMGNNGGFVHDVNGKLIVDTAGNHVLDRRQMGRFKDTRTPYWGGMIFRCNPDGSEFEVLGHNFRNNYEVAVDSFGNVWQSDNDDDGHYGVRINYILEGGNYGYLEELTSRLAQHRVSQAADVSSRHWHQTTGRVPNFVQSGAGSPTGITVYEGELLPKVFHNQVIHCDAGPGVVWAANQAGRRWFLRRDDQPRERRTRQVVSTGRRSRGAGWSAVCQRLVRPGRRLESTGRQRTGRLPHRPGWASPAEQAAELKNGTGRHHGVEKPNLDARHLGWQALRHGHGGNPHLDPLYAAGKPHERARALWLLSRIKVPAAPSSTGRWTIPMNQSAGRPACRATAERRNRSTWPSGSSTWSMTLLHGS